MSDHGLDNMYLTHFILCSILCFCDLFDIIVLSTSRAKRNDSDIS